MKKVALLFIILCAGTLNAMEPERDILMGTWQNIPLEVKPLIITAIAQSGNNLNEAIKNIVRFSQVNKELNKMINDMYGNPKGFKNLVHILAKRFDMKPAYVVGEFNTPAAGIYQKLAFELATIVLSGDVAGAANVIAQGTDATGGLLGLYFNRAEQPPTYAMVKLLLENGADPLDISPYAPKNALEFFNIDWQNAPEYEQIKTLLENAIKKQSTVAK